MMHVTNLKPFDGTDFSNWEFKLKLVLEQNNVLEVLSSDPPEGDDKEKYDGKDIKARNIMVQWLADSVIELVKGKKTDKEMFTVLKDTYKKKGTLGKYITDFEKIVTDLCASGGKIEDEEIISQLLASMPKSYQAVTTSIDIIFSTNSKDINFHIYHEANSQKPNCENHDENVDMSKMLDADCVGNIKEANFIDVDDVNNLTFVVDSGATHHMLNKQNEHHLLEQKQVHFYINVAKKGEKLTAEKCGNLYVTNNFSSNLKIKEVLVCNNLMYNLLSVNKIESEGLKVSFENKTVRILKEANIVAEGYLHGNLYLITFTLKYASANVTLCDADLLHRRMGYSSVYPPKKLCNVCLKEKQTRATFKNTPEEKKTKISLEVVSSDVAGPIMPTNHDGMRLPTSALKDGKMPAELWFDQKIDIDNIRIGCTSHVHVPKEARRKLDERSKTMRLTGYTNNGYRLWNSTENKIVTARSIIFDEGQKSHDLQTENNVPLLTFKDEEEGETVKTPEKIQARNELNLYQALKQNMYRWQTECLFIKQLLEDIVQYKLDPIVVYEDNQSCIKMASTLETKRSKQIDVNSLCWVG
ncbi:hypothetical protein ILUMI_04244 [Ignelater luminosus]|uniref:Copia protein n=1 Tax=Ignelater luminosus TaxID=2038154 RepID=A0A8K0GER4_IGNLU|nr:hypothetical protein ILUMI_04244 [Ignelater luminosus]